MYTGWKWYLAKTNQTEWAMRRRIDYRFRLYTSGPLINLQFYLINGLPISVFRRFGIIDFLLLSFQLSKYYNKKLWSPNSGRGLLLVTCFLKTKKQFKRHVIVKLSIIQIQQHESSNWFNDRFPQIDVVWNNFLASFTRNKWFVFDVLIRIYSDIVYLLLVIAIYGDTCALWVTR